MFCINGWFPPSEQRTAPLGFLGPVSSVGRSSGCFSAACAQTKQVDATCRVFQAAALLGYSKSAISLAAFKTNAWSCSRFYSVFERRPDAGPRGCPLILQKHLFSSLPAPAFAASDVESRPSFLRDPLWWAGLLVGGRWLTGSPPAVLSETRALWLVPTDVSLLHL